MAGIERVAITGSTGFLGKAVFNFLAREQIEVISVSRSSGFDLTKSTGIDGLPGFDLLIHLAAKVFVPASYENPRAFIEGNTQMTLNALELCRTRSVPIVFASSYVYGQPRQLPVNELHPVGHWNPYASSKLLCEEYCRSYAANFDVPVRILRLFNLFGHGQDKRFLIPKIIDELRSGGVKLENPKPKRDYLHVKDAAAAFYAALSSDWRGVEVFNVGSGVSFSVSEIAEKLAGMLGVGPEKIEYSNHVRSSEISDVVADTAKIRQFLDWSPSLSLEDGLRATLAI